MEWTECISKAISYMDYKIVKKEAFTVIGAAKVCKYDNAAAEVPQLWAEYYQTGKSSAVCSAYGISIDEDMGNNEFEYLIGDNYKPANEIPQGFTTRVIPAHTWAAFACIGVCADSLPQMNKRIFSEWLPACKDYEIAAAAASF